MNHKRVDSEALLTETQVLRECNWRRPHLEQPKRLVYKKVSRRGENPKPFNLVEKVKRSWTGLGWVNCKDSPAVRQLLSGSDFGFC